MSEQIDLTRGTGSADIAGIITALSQLDPLHLFAVLGFAGIALYYIVPHLIRAWHNRGERRQPNGTETHVTKEVNQIRKEMQEMDKKENRKFEEVKTELQELRKEIAQSNKGLNERIDELFAILLKKKD